VCSQLPVMSGLPRGQIRPDRPQLFPVGDTGCFTVGPDSASRHIPDALIGRREVQTTWLVEDRGIRQGNEPVWVQLTMDLAEPVVRISHGLIGEMCSHIIVNIDQYRSW
jgi:hypothetical protein